MRQRILWAVTVSLSKAEDLVSCDTVPLSEAEDRVPSSSG